MSSATDTAAAKAETTDESKHAFGGAGALVANGEGEGEGDVKVAVETTTATTTATTTVTTALDDSESDAPTPAASPMPTQTPLPGRPNERVYTAVYSGIPVYEMMYKGIQIMRRIDDSRLNATQILKAAGFSKPKRTKILELEVLQLVHEKIQGGYGKYQGTWLVLGVVNQPGNGAARKRVQQEYEWSSKPSGKAITFVSAENIKLNEVNCVTRARAEFVALSQTSRK
ncbi:DNA-binding domain of Mlu1-box binding protein MBP1 [Rhizoclosmatium globosum]|uniref:DNA-binding domain of Mlu1-box binding protein MBP1 n=1 Tax=Rhizoclosmatium globosum TaxID=329046 RepID=A0A1Y2CDZ5_9FUNG|nr:DNA-binding domain of Mlu1-box binding protein MBP1 [Rhizoclosmatium globosum]|eukprot:ORY45259.1 DNA-binding domain of Mlu1-box binding protein MBP1 [Rhizoclosmatium globosum]